MGTQTAAYLFCAVLALLAVFQLALAAGAPLGRFAWGGAHDRLPPPLRIGSLVSIVIYAVFAAIILQHAGLVALMPMPEIASIGIWVIVGYMALGIVMNAISRSKPERLLMTPVAFVLFVFSLVVALRL